MQSLEMWMLSTISVAFQISILSRLTLSKLLNSMSFQQPIFWMRVVNIKYLIIYIFVKKAIEGDPLEIHGSGMQKRNFIHVRDLAEASVKALENTEAVNKKLVIAHSMDISILELAERVKDIVNPDIEVRFIESTRDNDYKGAVDNIEASYNILQWK